MPTRSAYGYFLPITTRWKDNDIYGHVNNVEYLSYFDTIINTYLIKNGEFDIHHGSVFGYCAEVGCKFLDSFVFPEEVTAGLRVVHIGNSSIRYELALFKTNQDTPAATGFFVHVFVDRTTRRPIALPAKIRAAVEAIQASRPAAS